MTVPFIVTNLISKFQNRDATGNIGAVLAFAEDFSPPLNTFVSSDAQVRQAKKPKIGPAEKPKKETKVAVTGSVAVINMDNEVEASIGAGVRINQDTAFRDADQSVTVVAKTTVKVTELAGLPISTTKADKFGLGGSVLVQDVDNSTIAKIADSALIHTGASGSLTVNAVEDFLTVDIAVAFGKSGAVGISGSFDVIDHTSVVEAFVGTGVKYDGGAITIQADDDIRHITVAGANQKAGNVGFGVSGAIVDVDSNTQAYLGRRRDGTAVGTGGTDINSSGNVLVKANSTGAAWSFSLAGSSVSPAKTKAADAKDDPANAGSSDLMKGSAGFGLSGDVSIHTIADHTRAYVNDSGTLTVGGNLTVEGSNDTNIHAAAGAVTLVDADRSAGIAGSYAQNTVTGDVRSFINAATVNLTGNLKVSALTDSDVHTYAASGQSGGTLGIAGQVTINKIARDTESLVENATIVRAGVVEVLATDTSSILSIAGAVTLGGKAGIGASIALDTIDDSISASIKNSDVSATGNVTVNSDSEADIRAITAAVAAGKAGMQGAGSVSINKITNDVLAYILEENPGTSGRDVRGNNVSITASDDTTITADGGGVGLAIQIGSQEQGSSASGTIGLSVAINEVEKTTRAFIQAATVVAVGALAVTARSKKADEDTYSIDALLIAGAVSANDNSQGTGGALAGAGAGARNVINRIVEAYIKDSPAVSGGTEVTVFAQDESSIRTDSGGFSALLGKGSGSGGRCRSASRSR